MGVRDYSHLEAYADEVGVPACLLRAGASLAGVAIPQVGGVEFVDADARAALARVAGAMVAHVPCTGPGMAERLAMPFGRRLKFALESRGMSQYRLAKETNITQSRISLWIRGTGVPGPSELVLICRALDVPFFLLSEEAPAPEVEADCPA